MEVVFLLAIPISLFLLIIYKTYYAPKSPLHPPGPRGLPFIGNMHQFDPSNTHLYLYQLSQIYGPLISLQLGSVRALVVSSVTAATEVFRYHDLCFSSRPALVGAQKISYKGLDLVFSPYNDHWRKTKKIATLHLFSAKRTHSFRSVREEEVARMVKTVRDKITASDDSSIVNLNKTVIRLTSSIIFRMTFGKRFDDGEYGQGDDNKMSRKIQWLLAETQANSVSFFVTNFFPLMGRLIDRLSGAYARLEKSFNELDAFYQQFIDENLQASTVSAPDSTILNILLKMNKDSSEFTFDHIKAILMNFIVAGSDTNAAVVVWAMTLLVKNPTTMKKVQDEVREFTGNKGFVDENDIQKLVYLKAVVKETMRLNPPAPLLVPRETTEKCVISGYEIDAKTLVYINAYALGRDPEFWVNPDKFLPERFLNSSTDFRGQDYEFIPFGAGRRMCPGLLLGVIVTELVLANLLYSFDWELPPGMEITDIDMASQPGTTMHKKNHLNLVPKFINYH
ncbi:hypothetical protein ACET3Z_017508 [Daucus carota]